MSVKAGVLRTREDLRWVDNTDHAILAVLALCAVEPDRCRGVLDLVWKGCRRNSLHVGRWDEATPEAILHGLARVGKGSLGDGVVLGPEREGDSVALSGLEAVWLKDKITGLGTDKDLVVRCKGSAGHGRSSEDGGEMHYDRFVRKRD